MADLGEVSSYDIAMAAPGGESRAPGCVLDAHETMLAIVGDLRAGAAAATVAARFHNGVARATAEACARAAEAEGTGVVDLSGGVSQNRLLAERTVAALSERGLTVLMPEQMPPNDGRHLLRAGGHSRGRLAGV